MSRKFSLIDIGTKLLLVLVVISSCSNSETKIPSSLIQPPKMQNILVDVMLVEARVSESNYKPDSLKRASINMYAGVFKKHNISKGLFFKSMDYYVKHPALITESLQPVIDSLNTLEARTPAK